eukprot:5576962-Pyramimonas_sp.AAC.1
MKLSRQHPQVLDARLFYSKGCAKVEHLVEFGDKAKDYLRDGDLQRFKYLVDIEGDGCSGSISFTIITIEFPASPEGCYLLGLFVTHAVQRDESMCVPMSSGLFRGWCWVAPNYIAQPIV